jgi:DNA-binding transcriptional ArsR family regulator
MAASATTPVPAFDDPRTVKAFGHPLRVRILAMLQERSATPLQLAGWLGARLGTVAYHVRTLHQLGFLELVDETRVRGAVAHHYRAAERPVVSDAAWAAASPVAKQAAVGATLQTLNDYAAIALGAGGFDVPGAHLSRRHLRLDAQGFRELSAACAGLLARVQDIEAAAAARLDAETHPDERTRPVGLAIMAFDALELSDAPPAGVGADPAPPDRTHRPDHGEALTSAPRRAPTAGSTRPPAKRWPPDGHG